MTKPIRGIIIADKKYKNNKTFYKTEMVGSLDKEMASFIILNLARKFKINIFE
jgi:hypothetical protein